MADMPRPTAPAAWPGLARPAGAAWATLWAGGLLAPALVSTPRTSAPWLVGLALVGIGVLFVVTTADATARAGTRRTDLWFLVVAQAALTGLLALDRDLAWGTLPLLLAIAVGASTALRLAPWVVAAVAGAGAVIDGARGVPWGEAVLGTGSTTLLAGLLTWAFGWLASVIAELHRTRRELADTAVAAERLRFSRDLHDLLGHSLSVVSVKAQAAGRSVRTDPDAAERHAGDIARLAQEALHEVRQAVQGYRGTSLDAEVDRATAALRAAGIATTVDRNDGALSDSQQELLSWVVREGATNVLRHARASHATIRTTTDRRGTTVVIEDDGDGPDPDEDASRGSLSGSGLAGLRERLTGSGGTLATHADAEGFRLSVHLPTTTGGTS
jgi:two-component system sensor histidine kinase DesK